MNKDITWIPISNDEEVNDGVFIDSDRHQRFMEELQVKPLKLQKLYKVIQYIVTNKWLIKLGRFK